MTSSKSTIIFEGLNCTGKSSLIENLQKVDDLKTYVHDKRSDFLSVELKDATYGYMKAIVDILPSVPMWLDRFHLTEYAYGIVHRGYSAYDASKVFAEIDWRLSHYCNAKIVYMTDSADDIMARMQQHRPRRNNSTVVELLQKMDRCIEATCLPVLKVNYATLNMRDIIDFIKGE